MCRTFISARISNVKCLSGAVIRDCQFPRVQNKCGCDQRSSCEAFWTLSSLFFSPGRTTFKYSSRPFRRFGTVLSRLPLFPVCFVRDLACHRCFYIAQVHFSLLSLWLVPLAAVFGQQCISKERLADAAWLGWIFGQWSVSFKDAMSQELVGLRGDARPHLWQSSLSEGELTWNLPARRSPALPSARAFHWVRPESLFYEDVCELCVCLSIQVQVRAFGVC